MCSRGRPGLEEPDGGCPSAHRENLRDPGDGGKEVAIESHTRDKVAVAFGPTIR